MSAGRESLYRFHYGLTAASVTGIILISAGFIALAILFIVNKAYWAILPVALVAGGLITLFIRLISVDSKNRSLYKNNILSFTESDILDQINNHCLFSLGANTGLFVTERYVVYCGQFIDVKENISNVSASRYKNNLRIYFVTKNGRKFRCEYGGGYSMDPNAVSSKIRSAVFGN